MQDVEDYVKQKDLELEFVLKQRDKLRNKLRNAKEPDVIANFKSDREMFAQLLLRHLEKNEKLLFQSLKNTLK